ncbi:hypothetical protein KCU98_g9015, partial [Aureobasidium melanogenum]
MNPSNNTQTNDSDSDDNSNDNDSIPGYGGCKHPSSCYEDFEMWNSVCEDAEPGWEYKEAQRMAEQERKKANKEVTRKRKEAEKEEVAEDLVRPLTIDEANALRNSVPKITHDNKNAGERNSIAEDGDIKIEHDNNSCQGLTLEEVLGISRPDKVKKQPRPASGARTCALM